MAMRKYSVVAWALAALLTASAAVLVLSYDPVVAGGGESGSGESGSGEGGDTPTPSGSGE